MISRRPFTLVIVAGPNGAGKSTFIRQYVEAGLLDYEVLNADEISRALPVSTVGIGVRNALAARILLGKVEQFIASRRNVIIETTLSGVGYARRIPRWQAAGYRIVLEYVALSSVDESIQRVSQRVTAGGHGIPEVDLRRRFERSLANLDTLYKPIVDVWYVRRSEAGSFPVEARSENEDGS
jgi:predicted ABC-type ATPase